MVRRIYPNHKRYGKYKNSNETGASHAEIGACRCNGLLKVRFFNYVPKYQGFHRTPLHFPFVFT